MNWNIKIISAQIISQIKQEKYNDFMSTFIMGIMVYNISEFNISNVVFSGKNLSQWISILWFVFKLTNAAETESATLLSTSCEASVTLREGD